MNKKHAEVVAERDRLREELVAWQRGADVETGPPLAQTRLIHDEEDVSMRKELFEKLPERVQQMQEIRKPHRFTCEDCGVDQTYPSHTAAIERANQHLATYVGQWHRTRILPA